MPAILEGQNICKNFGAFQALTDVNFAVEARSAFAIIGPNGAGKTTLFRVMTGEMSQNSGKCIYHGRDISRVPANERVTLGIGRTFQVARVFSEFTILENLVVAIEARERATGKGGFRLKSRPAGPVLDEAALWMGELGIGQHWSREARHLSLGDRKRLELALALALQPDILLLDEPTAGMSQPERHRIIDLITRVKAEFSLTIVLTEHDMDFVFRLADRLMVMNQGKVIVTGDPLEIRESAVVRKIYLGEEADHA